MSHSTQNDPTWDSLLWNLRNPDPFDSAISREIRRWLFAVRADDLGRPLPRRAHEAHLARVA